MSIVFKVSGQLSSCKSAGTVCIFSSMLHAKKPALFNRICPRGMKIQQDTPLFYRRHLVRGKAPKTPGKPHKCACLSNPFNFSHWLCCHCSTFHFRKVEQVEHCCPVSCFAKTAGNPQLSPDLLTTPFRKTRKEGRSSFFHHR